MKKILNLTETAKYVGIPKRTFFRMVEDGRFPVDPIIKTPTRMWSVDQIDSWLKGGK